MEKRLDKYDHFKWVDAMRGWAILGVIMVHVGIDETAFSFFKEFVSNGARGVQLFFIMSAFTIFYTYKKHQEKEMHFISNFYIRRFFRIAPLYYLGIFYYLWQNGISANYWTGYIKEIDNCNVISNFLFIHGLNPYYINSLVPGGWSISVEMMFYLLIPVLVKKINNFRKAIYFLWICMAFRTILKGILNRIIEIEPLRLLGEYLFLYLPNQLPVFSLGIVLYFILNNNERRGGKERKFIVLSFIILFFSGAIYRISMFFFLFAYCASQYKVKLVQNRVICFIGEISYSLYLVHFSVIYFYDKYDLQNIILVQNVFGVFIIKYFFILIIAALISCIINRMVEKPFIALGAKIIKVGEKVRNNT